MDDQPVGAIRGVEVNQMIRAVERVRMLLACAACPICHRVTAMLHVRSNVKVTGTLRQGAARCTISNGAVRPLAATCPSRPKC